MPDKEGLGVLSRAQPLSGPCPTQLQNVGSELNLGLPQLLGHCPGSSVCPEEGFVSNHGNEENQNNGAIVSLSEFYKGKGLSVIASLLFL